jgi:hypothetical protein
VADLIGNLAQDAMHTPAHSLRQVGSVPRICPIVDLAAGQLGAADHECAADLNLQATTAGCGGVRSKSQIRMAKPFHHGALASWCSFWAPRRMADPLVPEVILLQSSPGLM